MRFWQIRTPLFFCLVLWLCVGGRLLAAQQPTVPASTAPLANATVADLINGVQVLLPGQVFSAPGLGQVLPPDSEIDTGNGQILLQLEDGSDVLIYRHTHLVLKQPTTSNWQRLQFVLGRIRAEIQKRISGSPPFQIGTPSAVIAVRGTRFYVEVDKRKTTQVDVEEGEVQLENVNGIGAPVLIKAGFSSRVGEDSAPEPAGPITESQHQSGFRDSTKGGQSNQMVKTGQGNAMGSQHSDPPVVKSNGPHK